MSDFAFVATVTGVFFLIGTAFGALAVVAVSALRTDAERAARRRARRDRGNGDLAAGRIGTDVAFRGGWTDSIGAGPQGLPGPDEDDEGDGPPRWPGGFGGR